MSLVGGGHYETELMVSLRLKRPANINTSIALDPIPQPSFIMAAGQQSASFQPAYVGGPGAGFFQPPPVQHFASYPPPSQPVPGPSRRPSHQSDVGPSGSQPQQQLDAASTSGHSAQRSWDAMSSTTASSSHKRKRSSSSHADELRTPRKGSQQPLPGTKASAVQGLSTGQSQLPTPPSTGDYVSTPTQQPHLSPEHQHSAKPASQQRSGVYVTATEAEGRKLGLVRTSTGTESIEAAREHGPPRTKPATVLSINSSGVATVGSANVLQTDASLLDEPPKTPVAQGRQPAEEVDDTPRTKDVKVKRRLSAFKTTSRPAEPMYSTRLDMGHGGAVRVALRKDIALAFLGMDHATAGGATEEQRCEDEDRWAASTSANREPVRPDWPDEEAPWKHAGGRRAKQLREDRERMALLQRYLESSSDDDDDHDAAARVPIPTRRHQSRPSTESNGPPPPACDDPTDARAALWFAIQKARRGPQQMQPPQMIPTGVINCICKSSTPSGSMVSCSSCKSWHHVACVGLDAVSVGPNWVCDPCVHQARRATLSTPSQRTPPQFGTDERSMSAFRGNQALALAPSPMFAPEAARAAAHSGGMATRTPHTPSRRRERARVLSYGNEWGVTGGDNPSTPMPLPRFGSFSTPRVDDPVFDVNSTPSRHLDTDPRMAGQFGGSLFAITPLVGRSRNSNPLIPGDTPMPMGGHGRNVSGVPPFTDGVASRHDFLQGLTADRDRRELPDTPLGRRGLGLGGPTSPSPFNMGHRRSSSMNKFSHLRSSSRSGLVGLGLPMQEDGEAEAEAEAADAAEAEERSAKEE